MRPCYFLASLPTSGDHEESRTNAKRKKGSHVEVETSLTLGEMECARTVCEVECVKTLGEVECVRTLIIVFTVHRYHKTTGWDHCSSVKKYPVSRICYA